MIENFEVASCNSDAEVSGGAGGINAICSRPEVADDVISGYDVETFRDCEFVSC